jgi:hypothetical protein
VGFKLGTSFPRVGDVREGVTFKEVDIMEFKVRSILKNEKASKFYW